MFRFLGESNIIQLLFRCASISSIHNLQVSLAHLWVNFRVVYFFNITVRQKNPQSASAMNLLNKVITQNNSNLINSPLLSLSGGPQTWFPFQSEMIRSIEAASWVAGLWLGWPSNGIHAYLLPRKKMLSFGHYPLPPKSRFESQFRAKNTNTT